MTIPVTAVVEGSVDEAVIGALCKWLSVELGTVYGKQGKQYIDKNLHGYNDAARFEPWFVLRDLNADADCAPILIRRLLPQPAQHMKLRIAVRQVEAWLLADRQSFAAYFAVSVSRLPSDPDSLSDAKAEVIRLVGRSLSPAVRQDMIPRARSGASEGPAYASRMIEFAANLWDPREAARHSESLQRCIRSLEDWAGAGRRS